MKKTTQSGGGRGAKTKPLNGPGSEPMMSALIGGVGNKTTVKSSKKGK